MTQAFNLSQLANKVNTSGQLDASTGLYNQTPVANGGTGKSSVTSGALLVGAGTSAMTEVSGATPGQILYSTGGSWTAQPANTVGGNYIQNSYTAPATWTKPAGLKAIRVTVIGGGGNGGAVPPGSTPASTTAAGGGGGGGGAAQAYYPEATIPGPVAITAGLSACSFGASISATRGANGGNGTVPAGGSGAAGAGGTGTGGLINPPGEPGTGTAGGSGGGFWTYLDAGAARSTTGSGNPAPATSYGSGGGGAYRAQSSPALPTAPGGTGAPGIVIVEEFY